MKRLFNIFLSLSVVALYLLTTTGFGMHKCESSQALTVIFANVETCNSDIEIVEIPVSDCCASEHNGENNAKENIHTCNDCCSVSYEALGGDYKYSEQSAPTLAYEYLLAVAEIPQSENIVDLYSTQREDRYPPPDLFGETLSIYHFCQLRL